MARAAQQLPQLVESLESDGNQPVRLQAARAALKFKRTWLELAEALTHVRNSGEYRAWGYDDFLGYCSSELGLKSATVDKLTVSYAMLNKHAPDRLSGSDDTEIPSYQSLDYLARATAEPRVNGAPPRNAPRAPIDEDTARELHDAVFAEGQSANELRKRFDPVLRPRSAPEQQLMALKRAAATARRLIELLSDVEGLENERVHRLQREVDALSAQMEALIAKLDKTSKRESPAAACGRGP